MIDTLLDDEIVLDDVGDVEALAVAVPLTVAVEVSELVPLVLEATVDVALAVKLPVVLGVTGDDIVGDKLAPELSVAVGDADVEAVLVGDVDDVDVWLAVAVVVGDRDTAAVAVSVLVHVAVPLRVALLLVVEVALVLKETPRVMKTVPDDDTKVLGVAVDEDVSVAVRDETAVVVDVPLPLVVEVDVALNDAAAVADEVADSGDTEPVGVVLLVAERVDVLLTAALTLTDGARVDVAVTVWVDAPDEDGGGVAENEPEPLAEVELLLVADAVTEGELDVEAVDVCESDGGLDPVTLAVLPGGSDLEDVVVLDTVPCGVRVDVNVLTGVTVLERDELGVTLLLRDELLVADGMGGSSGGSATPRKTVLGAAVAITRSANVAPSIRTNVLPVAA